MKNIFDPQSKVVANADRAIEYLKTGNTPPVLVEFDPSNACNHQCNFCISGYIHLPESKGLPTFSRDMLSQEIMMRTCQELVEIGVKAVNWTGGGEPTANPALTECIEYLGSHGIKMGMFTNGTLLHKFDGLIDAILNHFTWIRFSIDAGTPQTYNRVRKTTKDKNDWNVMVQNLEKVLRKRDRLKSKTNVGVGFVITPETYKGISAFAKRMAKYDIDYVQYKPEIVNIEREGGIQRDIEFWEEKVEPYLENAKKILGDKFKINGYKLSDLKDDPELYGRNYKKCLSSQIQPCISADGNIYVCTNHRGHKEYSYGSLYEKTFKEIWNDIDTRQKVMSQIEDVEKFSKCTALCKPHEANKKMWQFFNQFELNKDISKFSKDYAPIEEWENNLLEIEMPKARKQTEHWEFI